MLKINLANSNSNSELLVSALICHNSLPYSPPPPPPQVIHLFRHLYYCQNDKKILLCLPLTQLNLSQLLSSQLNSTKLISTKLRSTKLK